MPSSELIERRGDVIRPDGTRTVLRPFRVDSPESEGAPDGRTARIIARVMALSPEEQKRQLGTLLDVFARRHDDVEDFLRDRFEELRRGFADGLDADYTQARLIAAVFTEEFSVESAALFNPCVVAHPDQSGLRRGEVRFVMSLRGVGEGHVSSLVFQTGVWRSDGSIIMAPRSRRAFGPKVDRPPEGSGRRTAEIDFAEVPIEERVIYPFLPSQGLGIEDARFCRFVEDDGSVHYKATYTAFDGLQTRQGAMRTADFRHFVARRLDGDLANLKGSAWFPRKVGGRYAMLARLDDESVFFLRSDDPDRWTGGVRVLAPTFPWEIVQMGNCGSPIEIDEGWLILTHRVGKARTYAMGAALLDREDPTKILGRTPSPILIPSDDDEGGYVPNVVYSCGGIVRDRSLLLPYGVADEYAAVGTLSLDRLIAAMC